MWSVLLYPVPSVSLDLFVKDLSQGSGNELEWKNEGCNYLAEPKTFFNKLVVCLAGFSLMAVSSFAI